MFDFSTFFYAASFFSYYFSIAPLSRLPRKHNTYRSYSSNLKRFNEALRHTFLKQIQKRRARPKCPVSFFSLEKTVKGKTKSKAQTDP